MEKGILSCDVGAVFYPADERKRCVCFSLIALDISTVIFGFLFFGNKLVEL